MAQFDVNSTSVENIISSIKAGEIAIPEIQRPFVWDASKVRDLMDSLYKGFPVGYIIVWKNPDIRLKDGKVSSGKKILIDGQQRITAESDFLRRLKPHPDHRHTGTGKQRQHFTGDTYRVIQRQRHVFTPLPHLCQRRSFQHQHRVDPGHIRMVRQKL